MRKKIIGEIDVTGNRVLVRVDFDVAQDEKGKAAPKYSNCD